MTNIKLLKEQPAGQQQHDEFGDVAPPEAPSRRISEGTTSSSRGHPLPPHRRRDDCVKGESPNEGDRKVSNTCSDAQSQYDKHFILSKTGKGVILDESDMPNKDSAIEEQELPSSNTLTPSSSLSLPVPQTSLHRARAGIPSATRPGALAIHGLHYDGHPQNEQTNNAYDNLMEESVTDEETSERLPHGNNDDFSSSVLVTAELVTPPNTATEQTSEGDIEQGSSSPSTTTALSEYKTPTPPELVKAEPVNVDHDYTKSEQRQFQMVDLWMNRKTRLLLVIICLVMLALIVGIVGVVLFGGGKNDTVPTSVSTSFASTPFNSNSGVVATSTGGGYSSQTVYPTTEYSDLDENDDSDENDNDD